MLMVHGVVDSSVKHKWAPLWSRIDSSHFDKVINILSNYYHFVSLDDAVAMLEGRRKMQPYSMVVTFDDGYRNNLKYAQPILEKYNIPATIFLATGFVTNQKPFWIDRLDYALQSTNVDKRKFMIGGREVMIKSSSRKDFQKSYMRLRLTAKAAKRADQAMLDELNLLSEKLEKEANKRLLDFFKDDDWSGILSWDDIKKSLVQNICYGAHTVDHARLEFVDLEEARKQILLSKNDIEQATGKPCEHFCYPNGSFNHEIVNIVRDCGYKSALTSTPGSNSAGDNLFTLKRVPFPVNNSTSWVLAEVTGLTRLLSIMATIIFDKKSTY